MSDYFLKITRVDNGYTLESVGDEPNEEGCYHTTTEVVQDSEDDALKSGEQLLWNIIEFFGLAGSRHDRERLVVERQKGDKYEGE